MSAAHAYSTCPLHMSAAHVGCTCLLHMHMCAAHANFYCTCTCVLHMHMYTTKVLHMQTSQPMHPSGQQGGKQQPSFCYRPTNHPGRSVTSNASLWLPVPPHQVPSHQLGVHVSVVEVTHLPEHIHVGQQAEVVAPPALHQAKIQRGGGEDEGKGREMQKRWRGSA